MTPSLDIQLRIGPEDQFQDELAIFGGQTRVVTNKFLSRRKHKFPSRPRAERERAERGELDTPLSPSQATSPGPTSSGAEPSPQSASTPSDDGGVPLPQQVEDQMEDVHPSLMEYLSLFPSAASISVVNNQQQQQQQSGLMNSSVTPSVSGSASASASVFSSPAGAGPSAFSPMHVTSPTITPTTTISSTPMAGIQTQPQQGVPSTADPLSFLSVLPETSGLGGAMADPSLFFSALAHDPAALDTNIFGSAFGGGDFGDQWNSLMRETGLFDAQGNFKQDNMLSSPTATVRGDQGHGSRDMYPTY